MLQNAKCGCLNIFYKMHLSDESWFSIRSFVDIGCQTSLHFSLLEQRITVAVSLCYRGSHATDTQWLLNSSTSRLRLSQHSEDFPWDWPVFSPVITLLPPTLVRGLVWSSCFNREDIVQYSLPVGLDQTKTKLLALMLLQISYASLPLPTIQHFLYDTDLHLFTLI